MLTRSAETNSRARAGTKVFLDFGMSFSMKKLFCAPPFLSSKRERSLRAFAGFVYADVDRLNMF